MLTASWFTLLHPIALSLDLCEECKVEKCCKQNRDGDYFNIHRGHLSHDECLKHRTRPSGDKTVDQTRGSTVRQPKLECTVASVSLRRLSRKTTRQPTIE